MEQSVQTVPELVPSARKLGDLIFVARESLVATAGELDHLVCSAKMVGWQGHLVLTSHPTDLVEALRSALKEHPGDLIVVIEAGRPEELVFLEPLLGNALADYQTPLPTSSGHADVEHWFVTSVEQQPNLALRLVSWFYHLISGLLFGTQKSSFRSGFAIIPGNSPLIMEQDENDSREANGSSHSARPSIQRLNELFKVCCLKKIAVRESTHYTTQVSSGPHHQNSTGSSTRLDQEPDRINWWSLSFRLWDSLKPWANELGLDFRFWWNRIAFPGRPASGLKEIENNSIGWTLNRALATMALLVASCFLLFSNLNFPLFEPDETRNSQIALNVLDSGNWISLTLNDEPYWNKPPALIWAIAYSYKTFGFSPWATRLPGAIASLLTVIAVLELGKKLVGFRAAFIAALALLMSCGFALISRWVIMDASFTFFVTVSSLSLILANRNHWRERISHNETSNQISNRQKRWLILAGLCGGAAMMLKGPVVLVLVLPPVLLAYAFAGEISFLTKRLAYFLIPFLLVATPWYLIISIAQPGFVENYFWKQNLVRFSDAFDHQAPWWFYLPITFAMTFPACYLIPWLIRFLFSSDESIRSARTPAIGFLGLMALWVIFFFSLSESKLPTYILPAVPFIALMIGALINQQLSVSTETGMGQAGMDEAKLGQAEMGRVVKSKTSLFSFSRLPTISAFGFVAFSLILIGVLNVFWNSGLPISIFWMSLITIATLLLVFWSMRVKNHTARWIVFAVNGLIMMSTVAHFLIPHFAELRSTHQAIANLRLQSDFQSAPVVFLDRHSYSVSTVVSEREVYRFQANQKELFQNFLASNPRSIIVAPSKMLSEYCQPLEPLIELEKHVLGKKYVHRCSPKSNSNLAAEKRGEPQLY